MAGFGGGFDMQGGGGAGFGGGYGGGAGNGGGGFMNGGSGYGYNGGAGGGGSGGMNGGGGKSRTDSFQPVTIKQLLSAGHDGPDDMYSVNGQPVAMVTFLGRILACETQITMIQMQVDDCTGTINAVYTIDPDEAEASSHKREHIRDFNWVRIIGTVREVDGAPQVDAITVNGVDSMNEVTYHKLEVVRTFCSQTRPRPTSCSATSGITPVRQGLQNVGLGLQNGGPVPYSNGGGGVGFGMGADDYDDGSMSPHVKAVYNYLKSRHEVESGQGGVHVAEIANNVPVGGEGKVREILEELAQDGHVYSTTDDNHYSFCQA